MPPVGSEQHDLLEPESVSVTVAKLRLRLAPRLPVPRVEHLRAAVSSIRPELDLLHQHGAAGLIYRYPRVLYQISDGEPTIVVVSEGVEVLSALELVGADLRLGETNRRVIDAALVVANHELGTSGSSRRYRFTAPWLALNQENHSRFGHMGDVERRRFLDAQVTNNCLSLAKSFGLRITARLASRAHVWPVPVCWKGIEMVGFLGSCEVNFHIPEGLGLGKSVSRGFGAIRRFE